MNFLRFPERLREQSDECNKPKADGKDGQHAEVEREVVLKN